MGYRGKSILYRTIGLALCIVPAVVSVLSYFPIWTGAAEKRLSALTVILLAVCVIPFWKQIREWLKSPSIWQFYLVAGVILFAVDNVAGDISMICLISFPFSAIGGFFFYLSDRNKHKMQVKEDEEVRNEA